MELDFRKSPAVLEHILDTVVVGIFTVSADGRFVAWNRGAEIITGYLARDLIGQPCGLLEGPNCKGFAALTDLMRNVGVSSNEMCHQECKILSKDGREIFIHGNVQIVRDDSSRVNGAVGCFMDVTSLVAANEKIAILERQSFSEPAFERLIGQSEVMCEIFRQLDLAADSDVTVMLTGESGTGKELAAQAIHARSRRRDKPFMAINCSAIPENLLESELFGHAKGAYTGASADRAGLFESADGGTLFLDEIGDISTAIQVKLLRALQEREIRRIGESKSRPIDVRLITATNRDLQQLVSEEKVREDFYYRIHVFPIRMPPLRERRSDIPLLVEQFIRENCQSRYQSAGHRRIDGIAKDTLDVLMDYHWPGNIRELRNAIEHACVKATGDRISYFDLPPEVRGVCAVNLLASGLSPEQASEKTRIEDALRRAGGNRTKAAEFLGTSRVTLWKKMSRFGIEV
ncbi:MAG: sigma 54-interacting transcriptional regulator [Planctomycetales bacterium]|nr:sigma 54-interacting transcriptional regulator [Planctomycetales bacterium]